MHTFCYPVGGALPQPLTDHSWGLTAFSSFFFLTLIGQCHHHCNPLMFRMGFFYDSFMRMSLLQLSIVLRWSVCNFHQYWFYSPCPPSGIWCVSGKSTNRMLQGTLMITQHTVPTRGFWWAVVMVTGSEGGMSLAEDFFLSFRSFLICGCDLITLVYV